MAFKEIEQIVVLDKNGAEQIVVTRLVTPVGHTFADVRLFVKREESSGSSLYKATHKGIAIPAAHISEIVAALQQVVPDSEV